MAKVFIVDRSSFEQVVAASRDFSGYCFCLTGAGAVRLAIAVHDNDVDDNAGDEATSREFIGGMFLYI